MPSGDAERARADTGRRRVVIVGGGGFGGLTAARELRGADVEVTVVDRMHHHLFQPLLYQVACGGLAAGEIAPPIRAVLRRARQREGADGAAPPASTPSGACWSWTAASGWSTTA